MLPKCSQISEARNLSSVDPKNSFIRFSVGMYCQSQSDLNHVPRGFFPLFFSNIVSSDSLYLTSSLVCECDGLCIWISRFSYASHCGQWTYTSRIFMWWTLASLIISIIPSRIEFLHTRLKTVAKMDARAQTGGSMKVVLPKWNRQWTLQRSFSYSHENIRTNFRAHEYRSNDGEINRKELRCLLLGQQASWDEPLSPQHEFSEKFNMRQPMITFALREMSTSVPLSIPSPDMFQFDRVFSCELLHAYGSIWRLQIRW